MRKILGIVFISLLIVVAFGSLLNTASAMERDRLGNVWATCYYCVYESEIAGTQTVTRTISGRSYTLKASFLFGGYGVAMQGKGRTGTDGDYIEYVIGSGGPGEPGLGDLVHITDEVRQRYAEELGITDFTGFGGLALPNPSGAEYRVVPAFTGALGRILRSWHSIAVHVDVKKRAAPLDAKGMLFLREGTTPENTKCMSFSVDDTGGGEIPEGINAEYWIDIYVGEGELAYQTWLNTGGNRLVDLYVTPIGKGLAWLRCHQNPDGSWYYTSPEDGKIKTVGLTSLALTSFLNYGIDETDPTVSKALTYILSHKRADGSITTGGWPVYDTSLGVLALLATDNSDYADEITDAVTYLIEAQTDEGEGLTEADDLFGGWPYEKGSTWSDLSITQFALLALHDAERKAWTGVDVPDQVWIKAEIFVSRCQNPDGGFTYQPGWSPWAPGSYGSMTAAGIWSLKCCGIETSDERIQNALNWLGDNYYVEQNYPIGNAWLHYYQYTLAKALVLAGVEKLNGHDWYQELSDLLVDKQGPDGSWLNPWLGEYYGTEKEEMATSQAILTLETKAPPIVSRFITFKIDSPADLHIYDPLDRHVGIIYETGEVEIEIPGATYSGPGTEPQVITIQDPIAGTYRVELIGREKGDYILTIDGMVDTETIFSQSFEGSIDTGECWLSDVTVSAIAGPLTIYVSEPKIIITWEYEFEDQERETILRISINDDFFQFIALDKDYGIRKATYMRVHRRTITIRHEDNELRLITLAVDTKLDFCVAIAWDKQTRKQYILIDKPGIE
jgi:squalene-hopene/tetraprenyl-beta-curcumene cyclase